MSKKKFMNKALMYQYDKEIAAAFQIDCEEFLNEFEKYQSFNFSDFQKVWQQQMFSYIFAGQNYALLLRDFCENCFYVIKKYIIFPRTLFTQIGAFYLLYSLYYKQPLKTWIKVRLTLEEYKQIYELIIEMKNRLHMEPVYIFSKMKAEGAFLYVAQRKPLGPEDRFVKDVEMYINDTFTSSKTQSSLIKFQEMYKSPSLINELESTTNDYSELLEKYAEKCPTFTPFKSTIINDMKSIYENFENAQKTSNTDNAEEGETSKGENSIQASRSAIKEKAMSTRNAVYRANRKVKIAVEYSEDSDTTDD